MARSHYLQTTGFGNVKRFTRHARRLVGHCEFIQKGMTLAGMSERCFQNAKTEGRRTELVDGIVACVADFLKRSGLNEELAQRAGVAVADQVIGLWGGQVISFPTNYAKRLADREGAIYAKFDGFNFSALSQEFGLTERSVRKLIARVRARKAGRLELRDAS